MTAAHMIQIALMGLGYMWVAWMIWQAFKDFREEEHPRGYATESTRLSASRQTEINRPGDHL